jgi:serine/threonine-protein kinase
MPDDETRQHPPGGDDATRAVQTPAGVTTSSGWLSTSGSIDHGRFAPGTLLGGRYRIVGRLGKGGMGEVYRADDLKLGQPVALKFLPPDVDRDPARLTQLHTEVRMARQVSHPNVCRVYDIDEVEGHTFLSMEYVDGEDLASLLRRIGRFPEDRALEVARQVCAGLAAAHERGVVHRDFKPANVMLDGSGKVRITDFGLAGVAGEALRAGTPAYMAPEQLAGGDVTVKSDIYALGLVLYEIFTGQRALDAKNLAELIRRREQAEIVTPSARVRDLSPDVDRAVMRCLAADPQARPASALSVAAALPGGDPLAAALAAGETPSPEMVAAAGEAGGLSRRAGLALLSFVLVGLAAAAFINDRVGLLSRLRFEKRADVLEDRAASVLASMGHGTGAADSARGVSVNGEFLNYVAQTDRTPSRWDAAASGHFPVLRFWYRTSPRPLETLSSNWTPAYGDPPLNVSGMTSVIVDDRGRLLEFAAVPPQRDPASETPPATPIDWNPLFDAAGLSLAAFTPAVPEWTPPVFGDRRLAWVGTHPHDPKLALRVEATEYRGRPVAFQVVWPWTRPVRMQQSQPDLFGRILAVAGTVLLVTLMAGAIALVRSNLRGGHADRRGAFRVAMFLLAVWTIAWAFGARHSIAVNVEFNRFFTFLAIASLNVGLTWLFYLAAEPFVRRYFPDLLISWTRVLAGQLRDERVGRDVLVGVALGVLFALTSYVANVVSLTIADVPPQPRTGSVMFFLGARYTIASVLRSIPNALQLSMVASFVFVLLRALVRSSWIASGLSALLFMTVIVAEAGLARIVEFGLIALLIIPMLLVFLRYGLLSFAIGMAVNQALNHVPLTLDLLKPYAPVASWTLLALAGIAGYAFYLARGSHRTRALP